LCSEYLNRQWKLSGSNTAAEILVENIAHLAASFAAASLPYRDARDLVIRTVAKFPDLPKNQKLSGTVRFASLRKTHAEMAKGYLQLHKYLSMRSRDTTE
jgi:hypothetical protein